MEEEGKEVHKPVFVCEGDTENGYFVYTLRNIPDSFFSSDSMFELISGSTMMQIPTSVVSNSDIDGLFIDMTDASVDWILDDDMIIKRQLNQNLRRLKSVQFEGDSLVVVIRVNDPDGKAPPHNAQQLAGDVFGDEYDHLNLVSTSYTLNQIAIIHVSFIVCFSLSAF